MFDLLADLNHNEDFLPCCSGSKILEWKNGEVLAEIHVTSGSVKAAFTTRNKNHPNESIEMRLVRGPTEACRIVAWDDGWQNPKPEERAA